LRVGRDDHDRLETDTVKALLTRFRRPRFADATSLLALFVALGGTGYAAATLPGNSVGSHQVRTGAIGKSEARTGAIGKAEVRTGAVGKSEIAVDGVGAAEIRRNAVDATELRDGGVELADLAPAARTALTDASAVTFRTAVTSAGAAASGNAKAASRTGPGEYAVDLGRDAGACQLAATLAGVKSGTAVEPPKAGFITATPNAATPNTVSVSIKDPASAPLDAPFHLLVAC
jgi:hypothetical protein